MSQLALFVVLKTKPDLRETVLSIWQEQVQKRASDNDSEQNYIYAFDMKDDTVIRISVVYDSMDAFHQTTHTDWFKSYIREITPHLDQKPEFNLATTQWVKGS